MKKFAVLNHNVVQNTIIADSIEIANAATLSDCIEFTDENPAKIGDTWDGNQFVTPSVEEPTE